MSKIEKIHKEYDKYCQKRKEEKFLDEYGNEIIVEEYPNDHISIPMPVYYYDVDDDDGVRHYDFEEMANELENRICKVLGRNVLITISEAEEE